MTRKLDPPVRPRDLMSNLAVRKLLGRELRADKKPINRHTLLRWRVSEGFPAPLRTPYVERELWDKTAVSEWLERRRPKPEEG